MKRLISFFLAALLLLTFSACAGNRQKEPETTPATVEDAVTETPPSTEDTVDDGQPDETDAPSYDEPVSPLMWRVTDGDGHELYLFGTIHVGDGRNDAVSERVFPVLEGCDALAVEIDVVSYAESPERILKDTARYVLTDGSKVSDYMPEELYERSYKFLEQATLFPSLFTGYNLAWWTQLVDSALLKNCSDLDGKKAMDRLLINHARDLDIPVLEIESSELQLSILDGFDNELYLLLIEDALDSTDEYGDDLNNLYELWLSGDRDALWDFLSDDGVDIDTDEYSEKQIALLEEYFRRLTDDRNLGMRDRAIEYLASGQTVFFAVGAAHMANATGLVQLLTDEGYSVEPFEY